MLQAVAMHVTLHINARGVILSGANRKGPFEGRVGVDV